MKLLLLLLCVVLVDVSASLRDLSGKMFTFPEQNNVAHVVLTPSKQNFSAITTCLRFFTDLKRNHVLFSLATPTFSNGFLIFRNEGNKTWEVPVMNQGSAFPELEYTLNKWHSVCATWDSSSGLVQLWFNGKPSVRRFVINSPLTEVPIIIIGQEQDSYGGGFNAGQSFVGMIRDIHMWKYVLSGCEIQYYVDDLNFTPGNVLNWRALDYKIEGRVILEEKVTQCH